MFLKKVILFFTFSLLVVLNIFCRTEEIILPRSDGSHMTVYLNIPDSVESFPLIIMIDGPGKTIMNDILGHSFEYGMQSVKIDFSVFSFLHNLKQIGTLAIEKRGITVDSVDKDEYFAYNNYEYRLQDYKQLVELISQLDIIPNWNREFLFAVCGAGSAEGFNIVLKIKSPYIKGTITGGGWIPYGEELKYQIKKIAENYKIELNENDLDNLIVEQHEMMLNHPTSFEKYNYKTRYEWLDGYCFHAFKFQKK